MKSVSDSIQSSLEHLLCQVDSLVKEKAQQAERIEQLQQQLDWFKRQLFGQKSEKRLQIDPAIQQSLFDGMQPKEERAAAPTQKVAAHERKRKVRDGCTTDSGLRFDENVPVKVVDILPDELKGDEADRYDVVSHKVIYRLAQQQASFVVIEERRPVIKEKRADS